MAYVLKKDKFIALLCKDYIGSRPMVPDCIVCFTTH